MGVWAWACVDVSEIGGWAEGRVEWSQGRQLRYHLFWLDFHVRASSNISAGLQKAFEDWGGVIADPVVGNFLRHSAAAEGVECKWVDGSTAKAFWAVRRWEDLEV